MSTITRERLEELAAGRSGFNLRTSTPEESMVLARIALASLEAEAVAWLWSNRKHPSEVTLVRPEDDEKAEAAQWSGWSYKALYTEPPVAVSVPDLLEQFAEFMAAESIKSGDYPDGWQCKASNAAHEYAQNIRAAVLQSFGNSELLNSPAIPDWQAEAEKMAEIHGISFVVFRNGESPQCADPSKVIISFTDEGLGHGETGHFREIGNSSTNNCRENAKTSTKCWCRTCRPVTISDMRFVVCPECGNKRCPHANDHRHACTGSNEPGQEGSAYPAAPQQEVK